MGGRGAPYPPVVVREEIANSIIQAVWHLFVIAGSVCRHLAIALYVLVPVA